MSSSNNGSRIHGSEESPTRSPRRFQSRSEGLRGDPMMRSPYAANFLDNGDDDYDTEPGRGVVGGRPEGNITNGTSTEEPFEYDNEFLRHDNQRQIREFSRNVMDNRDGAQTFLGIQLIEAIKEGRIASADALDMMRTSVAMSANTSTTALRREMLSYVQDGGSEGTLRNIMDMTAPLTEPRHTSRTPRPPERRRSIQEPRSLFSSRAPSVEDPGPPVAFVGRRFKPNPRNAKKHGRYKDVKGYMPSLGPNFPSPDQIRAYLENYPASFRRQGTQGNCARIIYCGGKGANGENCKARFRLSSPKTPDGFLYFVFHQDGYLHSTGCRFIGKTCVPTHRFDNMDSAAIETDETSQVSDLY